MAGETDVLVLDVQTRGTADINAAKDATDRLTAATSSYEVSARVGASTVETYAVAARDVSMALDRETQAAVAATQAQRAMAQVLAETAAKQEAVVIATTKAAAATEKVGAGGKNMGVALMAASNMTQDFAGASGDLGMKLSSVVNNIPLLVMGLGGPQGVAAAAMVAGQAVVSLIRNWDQLSGLFTSRSPIPPATDDLKRLEEQLKKDSHELEQLAKKTSLSSDELQRFNKLTSETAELEKKVAEERKTRAFFKEGTEAPTEEDAERIKIVKEALKGQGERFDENLEAVIRGEATAGGYAISDAEVAGFKAELKAQLARGDSRAVHRLMQMIGSTREEVFDQEFLAKLDEATPERMKAEERLKARKKRDEDNKKRLAEETAKLVAQGEENERATKEEEDKRAKAESKRKARVAEVARPFAAQMEAPLEAAIRDREGRLRQTEEQVRRELSAQVVKALEAAHVDPGMAKEIADSFLKKALAAVREKAVAELPVGAPVGAAPETAEAMLKAARAMERAGNTLDALAAYRRLREAHPEAPEAAIAGKRIEQLTPPAPVPPPAAAPVAMAAHEAPELVRTAAIAPTIPEAPAPSLRGMEEKPVLVRTAAPAIPEDEPEFEPPPWVRRPTAEERARPAPPEPMTTGESLKGTLFGLKGALFAIPNALKGLADLAKPEPRRAMVPLPGDRPPPNLGQAVGGLGGLAEAMKPPPPPPPPPPGIPLQEGPGMFAGILPEVEPPPEIQAGPGMFGGILPTVPVPGASVVPPKPTEAEAERKRQAALTDAQMKRYKADMERDAAIHRGQGPRPVIPPKPTPEEDHARRMAALTAAQREAFERDEMRAATIEAHRPAPAPPGPPAKAPGPGTVEARIARGRARTEAKALARTPTAGVRRQGGTIEDRIARVQQRRAAKEAQRRERLAQRDRVKAGLPAIVPQTQEQFVEQQQGVDKGRAIAEERKRLAEAREREALAKQVQRQTEEETGTRITPEQAREVAGKAQAMNKDLPGQIAELVQQGVDFNQATMIVLEKFQRAMQAAMQNMAIQARAMHHMGRGLDSMQERGPTALNYPGH